jgi:sugar phosphate permease
MPRAPEAELPETGRRRWAVLAVVSAAQFLVTLDLWVVNIALPALQRDFAPVTLSEVSWILDVYAIVLAALLLPAGRGADDIGRRKCFLAGLVVFGIASLGCAVAQDLLALITFRALQAAGAAVLLPTSLGLALEVFPSRQRGTAVGIWAAVGAVAAGSGPAAADAEIARMSQRQRAALRGHRGSRVEAKRLLSRPSAQLGPIQSKRWHRRPAGNSQAQVRRAGHRWPLCGARPGGVPQLQY